MSPVQNRTLIFKEIPKGLPKENHDMVWEESQIDLDTVEVPEGGALTKNLYISLDPYQRGRMRPAHIKSYSPAYSLNKPMNNAGIAKVLKSKNDNFKEGDFIIGALNYENYSVLDKDTASRFRKLNNPYNLPKTHFLGALGMPGLTAYSSFYEIGKPKKGETLFVSAASGAVGSIVGQLGKREGLKVIGSAGSDEKVQYLKDIGFDEAFNYRKEKPADALKKYAPEGIDINFENVGGETLEAAIRNMNDFGRVILCGLISQYNLPTDQQFGHKCFTDILSKRLIVQGFIVSDKNMGPIHFEAHQKNMQKWIKDGEVSVKEHVIDGLENAQSALLKLFSGENFGKLMLKIADE